MLKKLAKTTWVDAGATLFVVIGIILTLVTNSVPGWGLYDAGTILALAIVGCLTSVASIYVKEKFGSASWISALVKTVTIVLLSWALCILLVNRIDSSTPLFSWNSDNAVGWSSFRTGIAAFVFYFIATIALIVTSFFQQKKN